MRDIAFITLHSEEGDEWLINVNAISAITTDYKDRVQIYFVGDPNAIDVTESLEFIKNMLKHINQ